ncbi:MAG: RNA polymerase sigma-70 factor [Bacteroidales bacterium]
MPKRTKIYSEQEYSELFDQAYTKYLHRIKFYAFSFIGEQEDTMSIAQDAFVTLWEKRQDLDFEQEILPFLYSITKNKCINFLRKQKARHRYGDYVKYKEAAFNHDVLSQNQSVKIYEKEMNILIDKAIEAMKPKVKETFLLSRNKKLKNREVAQILNIGESTVEFRIAAAYNILRKYLKDYLPFFLWFLYHIG